jgi:hypothetical protein
LNVRKQFSASGLHQLLRCLFGLRNLAKLYRFHRFLPAEFRGLAVALAVVLPGELMKVFILKEGKEYNQGVAYLDDGTMVVVDNARKMISKTIDIVVTSVLQTTAGKMIFGRYIEGTSSGTAHTPAPQPVATVQARAQNAK